MTQRATLDQNLIQYDSGTKEIKTYTTDYDSDGSYQVQIKAVGESSEVLATHTYYITVKCSNPTITPPVENGSTYNYLLGDTETYDLSAFGVDDSELTISYFATVSSSSASDTSWITLSTGDLGVTMAAA